MLVSFEREPMCFLAAAWLKQYLIHGYEISPAAILNSDFFLVLPFDVLFLFWKSQHLLFLQISSHFSLPPGCETHTDLWHPIFSAVPTAVPTVEPYSVCPLSAPSPSSPMPQWAPSRTSLPFTLVTTLIFPTSFHNTTSVIKCFRDRIIYIMATIPNILFSVVWRPRPQGMQFRLCHPQTTGPNLPSALASHGCYVFELAHSPQITPCPFVVSLISDIASSTFARLNPFSSS